MQEIPTLTPAQRERFWHKVAIGPSDDCWEWQAATSGNGYGRYQVAGKQCLAHRVAHALATNTYQYPDHTHICHTCHNKLCVNPSHLYAGDAYENARDHQRLMQAIDQAVGA